MAKFTGPREPYRPAAPISRSFAAPPPSATPVSLTVTETWTESSFDLRQGFEVIEHVDLPPVGPATPAR